MNDGKETQIKKDADTLGEGEEKQEGDNKRFRIQSADIPQKVTKIEVYFSKYVDKTLSLVIHGPEGDPLWVGLSQ